jgi:hypothetical protein
VKERRRVKRASKRGEGMEKKEARDFKDSWTRVL